MFSHITLGTNNLSRSAAFYDAILIPIGLLQRPSTDEATDFVCWVTPESNQMPLFKVYRPFNGKPATAGNGTMIAFCSPSEEAVDIAYVNGLSAGGKDEGVPAYRPQYGDGYYGAYLYDPDGNKIHIVYRGDVKK